MLAFEPVTLSVVLVGVLGGAAQQALKALLEHRRVLQVLKELTWRDAVGIGFVSLGAASLVVSYSGWIRASGARADWWEAFHLEVGAAFLFVGAVDTIVMTRLEKKPPPQAPPAEGNT
jgi:hypothetical protein